MKFNIGDTITRKADCQGFEDVTILRTDDKYYYCSIINGTVSLPISTVESCYELSKNIPRKSLLWRYR